MEQYKKILGDKLYKGSQLSNFQLNTFLYQDNRPLPLGEQEVNVNEYEQFYKERDKSTCYRLSGKLDGLFTNVLFNVTGEKSYETILSLSGNTGILNPNVQIFQNFGYKDILLETDGWFYYVEPVTPCHPCTKEYLRPKPNDFYFLPKPYSGETNLDVNNNPIQNWYFKITYPAYSACSTVYFQSPYVTGAPGRVTLCDGIAIQNIVTGTLNGHSATYIETPINHNLSVGDQIIVRPFGTSPNQTFTVIGVDSNTRFWIDYWDANIPTNIIALSTANNDPLRFKRIFQGTESQYMIRMFKTLTSLKDYQIYHAGFSKNIFNDTIELYHYNLDINTSGYRDYLNRPLTEVYLTKIKYTNYDNSFLYREPWTLLSVGLETNFPNLNYDVRAIYGGSPLRPSVPPPKMLGFVTENDVDFIGDIVDYNMGNLTERVLVDAQYRFNTQNREDNFYGEGYYYKAHDKIQLLELSSQVERDDINLPDVNIPDYAVTVDGITMWRDILTPGFIDAAGKGVDYPFLNGCTYIFTDHKLCLRRQNPTQNQIYSASVATYIGSFQPTTCDFEVGLDNFIFSIDGNGGDNIINQYVTTLFYPPTSNIIKNSLMINNININGYTAPFDGIYPFTYSIDFSYNAILPSGTTTGDVTVKFVHKDQYNNIINTFDIGTLTYSQLTTGNYESVNFSNTQILILNQFESITVEVFYNLNATTSTLPFTINFECRGNLSSTNQILNDLGNNNNLPVDSLNYWLTGVNCEKLYGEYLDVADGEC